MKAAAVKALERIRAWWSWPAARSFRAEVLLPYAVQRALLVVAVTVTASVHSRWLLRFDRAVPNNPILDNWLRWDALHYLHVASEGYSLMPEARHNGFFPLFPYVVSVVADVLPLPWAAVLVSNLFALGALELLRRLALEYGDADFARRVVWVAILFPTSFYLTAGYSESTFLFTGIGAVWAWKTGRWRVAAVFAALTVLARPVGAPALTAPFVIGLLLSRERWKPTLALLGGAAVGMAALFTIYQVQTGDPLAFFHATGVQNLRVFWDDNPTPLSWSLLQDEGVSLNLVRRLLNWGAVAFAFAVVISLARRREWELALLCAVVMGIPIGFHYSFVDLTSMSRYVLGAFPLFLVLGRWVPHDRSSSRYVDLGSQMLQLGLASTFAEGQWLE